MVLLTVWTFEFIRAIFLYVVEVVFTALCTYMSAFASFPVEVIFWYLKHFRSAGMYCSTLLKQYPIFTSLAIWGWLNGRMYVLVWICSLSFLIVIPLLFITFCSPGAAVISSTIAKTISLLLTTSNNMYNLSWGYALHLVMWKVFLLRIFSDCLQQSTSTSKFPLCVFFTFLRVALVAIIFSKRKGENLATQTSKDSMTVNLGKFTASFFESDSDRFLFVFY